MKILNPNIEILSKSQILNEKSEIHTGTLEFRVLDLGFATFGSWQWGW